MPRYIPVIAPIARDAAGGKLNVNADSIAGHVAGGLAAEKLVLVSDTHGIRTASDDSDSYASHLTKAQIEALIQEGVINPGDAAEGRSRDRCPARRGGQGSHHRRADSAFADAGNLYGTRGSVRRSCCDHAGMTRGGEPRA